MSSETPIRILVVDDHPVVRAGLVALVGRRPDMVVVAAAGDGSEAVRLFEQHLPDVTLMDLRMPEMDGVAAMEGIRERHPRARIILLTTFDTDTDIGRGIRAGAMAYLLKDAPREVLMDTIRAVHSGQRRIAPEVAAKLAEHASAPELTGREREIVQLMAAGKTNREIAEQLFVSEGTVKTHINHIFDKLGVQDRTQAVLAALKRGIARLE
jgi:two-component system NarL family response regulator